MESKTAIQQAIEKCNKLKDSFNSPVNEKIDDIIIEITLLLPTEKEQIEQAYKAGYTEKEYLDYYPDKHSKEYYQHTYGQTND